MAAMDRLLTATSAVPDSAAPLQRYPGPRASELGELGVGSSDALLLGAEVDGHSDLFLNADDGAKSEPVVRHHVVQGIPLDVPDWLRDFVERTSWQIAPGRGACWLHTSQYAPPRGFL